MPTLGGDTQFGVPVTGVGGTGEKRIGVTEEAP